MVPDPNPGVAVTILWLTVPKTRAFPEKWPANDRVPNAPGDGPDTYPGNSEFWPMTANGLALYNLWRAYGCAALCVPLDP